jgi:hypothetical protein|uniref:carboxypeptidase-like regulatory domain-containing protein n=1 Tax=Gelidibacter sp. TaxID=2018083 RepID=UPI00404B1E5C
MKKLLYIVVVLSVTLAYSQNIKRVEVKGKIIVENNDIEGITIFNDSANQGIVTDENGEFYLYVGLNDNIEVRSLQFENFNLSINEDILKSKNLKIFLIEEINLLDEVIISSSSLTSNLKADMLNAKRFSAKLDAIYFGKKRINNQDFSNQLNTKTENNLLHSQSQTMIHGLNIVNVVDQLLLPLFRSEVNDKKEKGIPEVPAESIKYYFGSEFLADNFNIPLHRVEEFIRFVENENFDFSLLNYGKELELLEIINIKSNEFLKVKKD